MLVLIYFPSVNSDRAILSSDYTMVNSFLQPTFWTSILYKGVTVSLDDQNSTTDNPNINITIGACSSMSPLHTTVELPQDNLGLGSGRKCRYLTNQGFNSFYYLAGSSVSGNFSVHIQRGGTFHDAKLLGVREFDDPDSVCSNMDKYHPVLLVDINKLALGEVVEISSQTLKENTLMYLLVQTNAFGNVTVDTKVFQHMLYYRGLSDMPSGTCDLMDTAGQNKNASISFDLFTSRNYYIFVADRGEEEGRSVHYLFVSHPRSEVKIFAIVLLCVLFFYFSFLLFCLCCYGCCRKCSRTVVTYFNSSNASERVSLL